MCELVDDEGPQAAIEYLAALAYGDETRNAEVHLGHYSDEPTSGIDHHTHDSGMYLLSRASTHGDVRPLRRFGAAPGVPPGHVHRLRPSRAHHARGGSAPRGFGVSR